MTDRPVQILICRNPRTEPYTPPGHREDGDCCEGPYEPPHGAVPAAAPTKETP